MNNTKPKPSSSGAAAGTDSYGRAVARTAVAQICSSAGFTSVQQSALDALSDMAVRYITALAKGAHRRAELACRNQSNALDVINALDDLHDSSSGALKDLADHFYRAEESPFSRPIPSFPVNRKRSRVIPSFADMKETPPKNVPDWLPAFPDEHTYKNTPVLTDQKSEPRAAKLQQAHQRQQAEQTLLNLHRKLAAATGNFESTPGVLSEPPPQNPRNPLPPPPPPSEGLGNPFLATPFMAGERPASAVEMPVALRSESVKSAPPPPPPLVEAFAPAIAALKSGEVREQGEKRNEGPVKMRFFAAKIGGFRRPRDASLDEWFSTEEEKDDKKRRVEQILRESWDSTQELLQH